MPKKGWPKLIWAKYYLSKRCLHCRLLNLGWDRLFHAIFSAIIILQHHTVMYECDGWICSSLLGLTRHHDQFHSKHTSTCSGGKPGLLSRHTFVVLHTKPNTFVVFFFFFCTQVIVDLNMREDSWLGRYFGVVHIKIQETNQTLFGFDTRETIQRHHNFIISGELYSLIFWLLKVSKAISISYFACYECFRISYFWCVSFLQ